MPLNEETKPNHQIIPWSWYIIKQRNQRQINLCCIYLSIYGSSRDVVAKVLNYDNVVNEFKFQSFTFGLINSENEWTSLLPRYGLNNIITGLLQRCFWCQITHEGRYVAVHPLSSSTVGEGRLRFQCADIFAGLVLSLDGTMDPFISTLCVFDPDSRSIADQNR